MSTFGYRSQADDAFEMDLNVPKSGTMDIKTKSELADYAANLRQEWEEEKAKLKRKWNAKTKQIGTDHMMVKRLSKTSKTLIGKKKNPTYLPYFF